MMLYRVRGEQRVDAHRASMLAFARGIGDQYGHSYQLAYLTEGGSQRCLHSERARNGVLWGPLG